MDEQNIIIFHIYQANLGYSPLNIYIYKVAHLYRLRTEQTTYHIAYKYRVIPIDNSVSIHALSISFIDNVSYSCSQSSSGA